MDMKKLFHVLVVGGAVIGTGAGCSKPKPAEAAETPPGTPAQAAPGTAPAAAPTAKPDSDTNGTPPKAEAPPEEKGGGAGAW